jgi:hypothetical protein
MHVCQYVEAIPECHLGRTLSSAGIGALVKGLCVMVTMLINGCPSSIFLPLLYLYAHYLGLFSRHISALSALKCSAK